MKSEKRTEYLEELREIMKNGLLAPGKSELYERIKSENEDGESIWKEICDQIAEETI